MKENEEIHSVGPRTDRRGAQVVIHGLGERGITSRTVHVWFQFEKTEMTGAGRRAKTIDYFKMVHGEEEFGLYPIERKVVATGGVR